MLRRTRPPASLGRADPERPRTRALLELASVAGCDWDASIRRLVQLVAEMLPVERVTFWSHAPGTSCLHCDAGYIVSSRSFERGAVLFESDHSTYFRALLDAPVLSVEDVESDARTRDLRLYAAARDIASMLQVPVRVDDRLAGVLCHEHVGSTRRWTSAEEDFAMAAGQVVTSALAARARTDAETMARRAAFLDNVSRVIVPSLDTREIASRVVDLVVPEFADFAFVWALNEDAALEPLASTHADPKLRELVGESARAAADSPRPPGLTYVMTQGQSLLYPDVAPISLERLGAAQRARALALSARTIIAVPLTLAGKTVGVLSLCATDRHYRSEDLTLAEEVAERVAVAFENARLYEVAQRAIHARDEFLVLAAHELRTPLTALQLLALDQRRKTSRGAGPDPTVRAEALCRQVKRLVSLVEHMLEAVRIRADGVSLEVEACDLATIVGGRVAAAEERARREGCALTVRSESCVEGRWDRVRVAQVFDELLGNALKFGAGKPIEIAVDSDQGQALLAVRDHGVGIPADSLTAIFSPFERAVSREHFGGLGLGLFIARAVVEAHGGSIEVTSRPERETTFVVRLPMESAPLR